MRVPGLQGGEAGDGHEPVHRFDETPPRWLPHNNTGGEGGEEGKKIGEREGQGVRHLVGDLDVLTDHLDHSQCQIIKR